MGRKSAALEISESGEVVALGHGDELSLWRIGADARPGRLPEAMRGLRSPWDALAVVGEEAWLLAGERLLRVAADGTPRAPLALELPTGAGFCFSHAEGGAGQTPQVALLGGQGLLALSLDCGELGVEQLALEAAPFAAAPLGRRDWLVVLERSLVAVRGGHLVRLEATPDWGACAMSRGWPATPRRWWWWRATAATPGSRSGWSVRVPAR
jgi:hypothetical protein